MTFGLPDDYYASYADHVRNATDASINASAKKFVDSGQMVWVVIGARAKIESGIKGRWIGDVVVLDADGRLKASVP